MKSQVTRADTKSDTNTPASGTQHTVVEADDDVSSERSFSGFDCLEEDGFPYKEDIIKVLGYTNINLSKEASDDRTYAETLSGVGLLSPSDSTRKPSRLKLSPTKVFLDSCAT